ncbi:MAG: VOC family protein [Alcanivorax sp.]|nr:VOC family protein [Alcanivorax sp.]
MLPQPLIAVADVAASSRWYQQLLGCESGHGGADYEQLMMAGRMILQLHHWQAHDHPHLGDPRSPCGNGVLLWFQTDYFDEVVGRAREMQALLLEEPHLNHNAHHRECWIRDPDGYVVVIAGAYGDLG